MSQQTNPRSVEPMAAAIQAVGETETVDCRRRKILVDKRPQLRASILTTLVALFLLVPLNVSLHVARTRSSLALAEANPELLVMLQSQDRLQGALVLFASAIFLCVVFLVAMLEAHKTVGAAYNVMLRLREVRTGHYNTRVVLRKGDNLRELETAFNEMALTLQDRTWRNIETFERLAKEAEAIGDPEAAKALAARLRDLAGSHRTMVEDPETA